MKVSTDTNENVIEVVEESFDALLRPMAGSVK